MRIDEQCAEAGLGLPVFADNGARGPVERAHASRKAERKRDQERSKSRTTSATEILPSPVRPRRPDGARLRRARAVVRGSDRIAENFPIMETENHLESDRRDLLYPGFPVCPGTGIGIIQDTSYGRLLDRRVSVTNSF